MLKYCIIIINFLLLSIKTNAMTISYDSITISKFTANENTSYMGKWEDTLRLGKFNKYLKNEITVWRNTKQSVKSTPKIILLSNQIKANGTEDISKCFIPRHVVNYYKNGKIILFMLVCFECEGIRFSDMTTNNNVKDVKKRMQQIQSLKKIFDMYNLIGK